MNYRTKTRLQSATIIVGVLLAVEIIGRSANPISIVPISEMVTTAIEMLTVGDLLVDIRTTGMEVAIAFFLSTVSGILFGVLLWRLKTVNEILEPFLISYYAVPIFALYPLFLALFGLGILPIVTIAWLYGFVVIVVNTTRGLNKVSETHIKVGRSFNLSNYQMFRQVYFPSAVPYIFTGLKLAFIFTITGSIATEFIMANAGLGHLIAKSYEAFQTSEMYAGIFVIAIFAIAANIVLLRLEAYFQRGHQT